MIEEVVNQQQIQTVEDLAGVIWVEHFTAIIGPAQVEYMLRTFQSVEAISRQIEEGCKYYLVMDDQWPCGYIAVEPRKEKGELFLSKLYLLGTKRGKGIGRKAFMWCVDYAKSRGLGKITLRCNINNTVALDFYRKAGFVTTRHDIKQLDDGFVMDDYLMELTVL